MAQRNYWLDLFTAKSWEEFWAAGGTVTLYRPFCDTWNVYLNADDATLVAHGTPDRIDFDHREFFERFARDFNLTL